MLMFLTLFLSVTAADTLNLTVDEAIDFALHNNPEIVQLILERDKSIERVGQTVSSMYPQVTASGYYAYVTDVPVVDFGGTLVPFGANENYDVQVSLQQVLFAWGKLYNAFKISDLSRDIAELNLTRKKQDIRYSVTDAFYGILVLEEHVKQARASLEQLERFAAAVETRYKAGLVSQFDLLRAQVQVQNLKPMVIQYENSLNLAHEGFRLLLGMDLDREFTLTGELQMIDEEFSLEELTVGALQNRPELKNLERAERIARLAQCIARRANLPTIVGGATYDRSKPFGFMGDEWGSNVTFNLAFQWTLFSGFNNLYKSREAALALKETRLALDHLTRAITVEVKQAYLSFLAAKEAIDAAEKNVGQAKQAYDIIETRYRNGLATNLEVLDTELAYRQAQVNYLSALKNYNTSLAQIYKATGKED